MKIKFRVWDKSEKKMKRVYSIGFNEQGEAISIQDEFADNYEAYAMYDVDDYELMQSTGLKDKNGTEIYEWDIVEFKYPYDKRIKELGSIVWKEDKACFGIDMKETTEKYELYRITSEHYLTVVGNIYEHSHLLEDDNHASN